MPPSYRPSFLSYLPAMYQEESASREFLERFLSIFESEIYDADETISRIPELFDPSRAPEEFIPWLADWLSLDLYELLGEKNREYILHAAGFYARKGTALGLASLVSFLTGNKCCVKEYMNNVLRTYGREHDEAVGIDGDPYRSYCHKTSRTVDTKDLDLLSKMGTFHDGIHYTVDTRDEGLIAPNVVGLFIFLTGGLSVDKDELRKIIDSFLPVFVRVEIFTVEACEETVGRDGIEEGYRDLIHSDLKENAGPVGGFYRDTVSGSWLLTYGKGRVAGPLTEGGRTNNQSYRTPHSKLNIDIPL